MRVALFVLAPIALALAASPAAAGGRTISPRDFARDVRGPKRTVKLRPGERSVTVRLGVHPSVGADIQTVDGRTLPSRPGKNNTVLVTVGPGDYLVAERNGLSGFSVENWGGKQRIKQVPSQSPYRKTAYQLGGEVPAGFPTSFYERNPLHRVGARGAAGHIYHYEKKGGGYGMVWNETSGQRAHRMTQLSTSGRTSVEKDGVLYLAVFNPLMSKRAKLPAVTGDVEVIGLTPRLFSGFSYLVLKPTKRNGILKVADPGVIFDNYAKSASQPRHSGEFSYDVRP